MIIRQIKDNFYAFLMKINNYAKSHVVPKFTGNSYE